ncbi:flagellar hook-associated protein 1 FlgK [Desulfobaculum xiamenense]|uniref:Flagellar hook-associated protein 1 n=1 Tax=Desulfobaculum xiamenense TaxID=995050 RepID=A0A846QQP6_9BACT|nr:flagellar hook-associated protein FlgK [Desulfobaculum xiamenense]NJB66979.1 flagellar hook-associated protein 1 FlgK [Desulfobaculum xiamenense]
MPGVNSILDIGKLALFASQSAIEVTGNNISNVNTPGYSRQRVNLEESISIDYAPGQLGTGVKATEVFRYFDEFVEEQFTVKVADRNRWDALWQNLRSVDGLFNESSSRGISSAMDQFWNDWQDLTSPGVSTAKREALLGNTRTLLNAIHSTQADMARMQSQMNGFIEQEVEEVNGLLHDIAEINRQINSHDIPGQNNANALLDRRTVLVRELAQRMDIDTIDNGSGNFTVLTKAGQTLVDGQETFEIKFEGPSSTKDLTAGSNFAGDVYFDGSDDFEYTVEVVQDGSVTSNAGGGAALFRVSLDGGRTWMTDEDGNEKHFSARPEGEKVSIGDLKIWFGSETDSGGVATGTLRQGDTFTIVPKEGLYWYETTSSRVNITPQIYSNGADDTRRLTGGSLTGYFHFRDYNVGRYQDRLDAFAKSLAWEVNRLHSQGTGEQKYSDLTGTYAVDSTSAPLGSNSSGLAFADKLQAGNLQIYVYDAASGQMVSNGSLDFGGGANFDPEVHSLDDVVNAINTKFAGTLTAEVASGRLRIKSNDPNNEFAFGTDTSGLLAGLGVNTFFQGSDASSLELNANVVQDPDFIATSHVNGAGETNHGDNTTAKAIAELKDRKVTLSTAREGATSQTLSGYFNNIVGTVGADTAAAEYNYKFHNTLAQNLEDRQEEVSGVNLDEEMGNLIKFQHSYTAAAKLISTADKMLQTVMSLKN